MCVVYVFILLVKRWREGEKMRVTNTWIVLMWQVNSELYTIKRRSFAFLIRLLSTVLKRDADKLAWYIFAFIFFQISSTFNFDRLFFRLNRFYIVLNIFSLLSCSGSCHIMILLCRDFFIIVNFCLLSFFSRLLSLKCALSIHVSTFSELDLWWII